MLMILFTLFPPLTEDLPLGLQIFLLLPFPGFLSKPGYIIRQLWWTTGNSITIGQDRLFLQFVHRPNHNFVVPVSDRGHGKEEPASFVYQCLRGTHTQ